MYNVQVVLNCDENLSNLLALYSGFMADLAKCNVDHFKMGRVDLMSGMLVCTSKVPPQILFSCVLLIAQNA